MRPKYRASKPTAPLSSDACVAVVLLFYGGVTVVLLMVAGWWNIKDNNTRSHPHIHIETTRFTHLRGAVPEGVDLPADAGQRRLSKHVGDEAVAQRGLSSSSLLVVVGVLYCIV